MVLVLAPIPFTSLSPHDSRSQGVSGLVTTWEINPTPFQVPGRSMKAAGLELALGSRNRGDLREGMGQVTTKWDSSRGQEPGRDDESPPRPDPH
jgi:hypothetical protein